MDGEGGAGAGAGGKGGDRGRHAGRGGDAGMVGMHEEEDKSEIHSWPSEHARSACFEPCKKRFELSLMERGPIGR